jgi:HD superfamily phosphohydrolase YqeK
MQNDLDLLKKELVRRLEEYFGTDQKRIDHAKLVLKYAEELLKKEQADPYVVFPAAVLHDVGIKVAEKKFGSAAGHLQEQEGPRVAGEILVDMGYEDANIYEVCAIIAHHHSPGPLEDVNFKVLYDADMLVNLPDLIDIKDKAAVRKAVNSSFLTPSGKAMAEKLYA